MIQANTTFAGNVTYIIKSKDNEQLGQLVVTQSISNDREEIHVTSEIKVKKLITMVISYTLYSVFENNKLQANEVVTFRNHLPHDVMTTVKKDQGYLFTKNEKKSTIKDFVFCESMMYFNEPKDLKEIYSEFDGVFKSIVHHKSENRYDLTNPLNKNTSKYFYSNGMLQKAVVFHPMMTLYLYRK